MLRTIATSAALTLALAGAARAGDGDVKILTIGEDAPALDVQHWLKMSDGLKGRPVTEFEDGKVYVVEFWATWCGPCRRGIPHLSELQERYAEYGVTFIGISDEDLPTVVKFLTKKDKDDDKLWTDKMRYSVTTDPDGSAHFDYMISSGSQGIPTAFIVGKDGVIEWIGNPGYPPGDFDDALEAIVHGTWDRDSARAAREKQITPEQRDKLLAYLQLEAARRAGDWERVLEHIDGMLAKNPNDIPLMVHKFNILLKDMDRPDEAYPLGNEIIGRNWTNSNLLNRLAWSVVDDPAIRHRDYDFALKAAMRANELEKSQSPAIMDTLARVYFERGDLDLALEWQRKAVAAVGQGPMAADMQETLDRYEQAAAAKN